jgi:hypothetical protein
MKLLMKMKVRKPVTLGRVVKDRRFDGGLEPGRCSSHLKILDMKIENLLS